MILSCSFGAVYRRSTAAFLRIIHGAHLEPTKKYTHPMTESQEIGWISSPLVKQQYLFNLHIRLKVEVNSSIFNSIGLLIMQTD